MRGVFELAVTVFSCDPACLAKSPKPPEPRKYEKNAKKLQNPPPTQGRAPKKYEKNTKMVIFGPFYYFFGIFFVFLGPDPGWGILYFFRIFLVFSGFRGFLGSLPGKRDRRSSRVFLTNLFSQRSPDVDKAIWVTTAQHVNFIFPSKCDSGTPKTLSNQEWPRQTKPKKGQFMNFSQGHSGTKVQCESCLFSQGKTPELTKMGEIHELFVLALSLVWFAWATPDPRKCRKIPGNSGFLFNNIGMQIESPIQGVPGNSFWGSHKWAFGAIFLGG